MFSAQMRLSGRDLRRRGGQPARTSIISTRDISEGIGYTSPPGVSRCPLLRVFVSFYSSLFFCSSLVFLSKSLKKVGRLINSSIRRLKFPSRERVAGSGASTTRTCVCEFAYEKERERECELFVRR